MYEIEALKDSLYEVERLLAEKDERITELEEEIDNLKKGD